jgi:aminoglycoside 3-N-acetyltransferase
MIVVEKLSSVLAGDGDDDRTQCLRKWGRLNLARLPNKRVIRVCYELGGETVEIEEFDTSDGVVEGMPEGYFGDVTRAFLKTGRARTGPVGGAQASLIPAAALVEFAVACMERELGPKLR